MEIQSLAALKWSQQQIANTKTKINRVKGNEPINPDGRETQTPTAVGEPQDRGGTQEDNREMATNDVAACWLVAKLVAGFNSAKDLALCSFICWVVFFFLSKL